MLRYAGHRVLVLAALLVGLSVVTFFYCSSSPAIRWPACSGRAATRI